MTEPKPKPGSTPRTKLRRIPEKAVREREALNAVLDAGVVAHLAVTDDAGQPYIVPVGYARDGDRVLFHGSTGSRLFRGLAHGQQTCLTVTLLDGFVLARSTFESSMHYRGVMVLGVCEKVTGKDKMPALETITHHLLPGRWADARHPNKKELAATMVLSLSLDEASVKISAGPPDDVPEDVDMPIWAGVVPLREVLGTPVDAPDLRQPYPVPEYVKNWRR